SVPPEEIPWRYWQDNARRHPGGARPEYRAALASADAPAARAPTPFADRPRSRRLAQFAKSPRRKPTTATAARNAALRRGRIAAATLKTRAARFLPGLWRGRSPQRHRLAFGETAKLFRRCRLPRRGTLGAARAP